MRKQIILYSLAMVALLTAAAVSRAQRQRSENKYKTHKLALNSVLVSCEDEREPVVKHLGGPFVIVSCEVK